MTRGTAAARSILDAICKHPRARQRAVHLFVAVSIGVVALAFGAAGEGVQSASDPGSTEPARPPQAAAVPAAEIVERLQTTRAQLQGLNESIAEAHATAEVQKLFPDFEAEVESHAGEDLLLLERGVIPDRLADIEIRWLARQKVLTEWSQALSQRVQQFAGFLEDLAQQKARWKKTEAQGKEDELANSVLERIAALREEITDIESRARGRQNDVLTLQDRVVTALGVTDALLGEVDKVRLAQREQLFALDSEPLWKAINRARTTGEPSRDQVLPLQSALKVSVYFFEGRVARTAGFPAVSFCW